MFSIEAIMTTELITISAATSLADARSIMHDSRIHHLPVVEDEDSLIGLLTLTDVLAATDSRLREPDSRIHASEITVKDVMVEEVITVATRASLRQAALFIEKHKIGCLPVVDDGKLVGIITDTDFVAVAINLLEQLEETELDDEDADEIEIA